MWHVDRHWELSARQQMTRSYSCMPWTWCGGTTPRLPAPGLLQKALTQVHRRELQVWGILWVKLLPIHCCLINEPIKSSSSLIGTSPQSLMLVASKTHVKNVWSNWNINGLSQLFLSKQDITALFASNHFPLELFTMTASVSEVSVWGWSWTGWHLSTLYRLGCMALLGFAEKLFYADLSY